MQVSVGAGPARFYGPGALLWWLVVRALVGVGRLLWWSVCRPRTTAAVCGAAVLLWALLEHPLPTHVLLLVVLEVVYWWHLLGPASFRRRTRLPAWWRSVWVYRRRWAAAMRVAELTREDDDGQLQVPRLGRVSCTDTTDQVRVRGLLGQRFADWQAAGPMLAHVFGATDFRVHRGDNRRLTLELVRGRDGGSWNREGYELGTDLERADGP